jgi:hypothetical protein
MREKDITEQEREGLNRGRKKRKEQSRREKDGIEQEREGRN